FAVGQLGRPHRGQVYISRADALSQGEKLADLESEVTALAFSSDASRLLVGSAMGRVQLYDNGSRNMTAEIIRPERRIMACGLSCSDAVAVWAELDLKTLSDR